MKKKLFAAFLAVSLSMGLIQADVSARSHHSNKCMCEERCPYYKMHQNHYKKVQERKGKYEDFKEMNIVEVAASINKFSTLVLALQNAGLDEVLQGEGPFTVFAPTNAAFEKIDATILQRLLMPENREELAKILRYHVVSGNINYEQLSKFGLRQRFSGKKNIETLLGQNIVVERDNGHILLNEDSFIIKTDIITKNGIIHVVDQVLLPTK